jgi:hypothetical protein
MLRYRTARCESFTLRKNIRNADVLMPLSKAREMIEQADTQKKWAKLILESIEDYDAMMANPEWMLPDRAKKVEMLLGTLHARITNLKRTLE